jgi:outer membrane receptor protein involved in Fe transport
LSPEEGTLETVIVTAQKREENIQNVPAALSVISAGTLAQSNQSGLEDFYATVPGLSLANVGANPFSPLLAIRGLTNGGGGANTVGVLVDDVPVGMPGVFPLIDPSDLDHVEVLRGPQGTLYGSSSIGGLIKYVTASPTTDALSGYITGGTENVSNGDGWGYTVRGAVNVPVTDTLAFRVSAFTRLVPGWIDNPVRDVEGVNRETEDGGLASLLWRPSDWLSVKLNALIQDTRVPNPAYGVPGGVVGGITLGPLQQDFLPFLATPNTLHTRLYSAELKAHLGGIDVTSVTAYGIYDDTYPADVSIFLPNAVQQGYANNKQFSQEIRLSSTIGQKVDWMLGGFYLDMDDPQDQQWWFVNPVTGQHTTGQGFPVPPNGVQPVVSEIVNFIFPTTYIESAVFGTLTAHFTDRFNVQVGARESHYTSDTSSVYTGNYADAFLGGSPFVQPTEGSKGNAFTYLLTPQFKFSSDLMAYVRLASGYRPGGPNAGVPLNVPQAYQPDKTYNYELGVKGSGLEQKISFDADIYYIDWKDIQLSVINSDGINYIANAGAAKSEGVELSGQAKPLKGTTVDAWIVWNEAVLTKAFPPGPVQGNPGDWLPFVSRWSSNLSFQQEGSLGSRATGFVRATGSYVGDRRSTFVAPGSVETPAVRATMPSYFRLDLLAGVRFGSWDANVYANNVTNKLGVTNVAPVPTQNFPPSQNGYVYIQPRTVGVSLTYRF